MHWARRRSGRFRGALRLTAAIWLAAAFVTWNVVFDRQLAVEAARFTHQNVLAYQQGRPTLTIDTAFRPDIPAAVRSASLWTAAVLAVGGVTMVLASRRGSTPGSVR